MAVAKCLLVFLNIFVLIEAAHVLQVCGTDQSGLITGNEIHLGKQILMAGYSTFRVDIPEVCYGYTSGVKVIACDYDYKPIVLVLTRRVAYVKRKGSLSNNGYVTAKVNCGNGPYIGSSSDGKNEPPLSVHVVSDTRQESQEYHRALRSVDSSEDALDQRKHDAHRSAHLSNTHRAETSRDTANNDRKLNKARLEDENESPRRSNQETSNRQSDQEVRKALNAHIRQAAIAQAHHKASQDTRHSKQNSDASLQTADRRTRNALQSTDSNQSTDAARDVQTEKSRPSNAQSNNAEKASSSHSQSEQKRSRRDLQTSDIVKESGERDEALEDTASRLGSQYRNFQRDPQQASDAVREILAANARHDALAQASLQTLNEARRVAQLADARQASDIVRQTLEDNTRQAALAQASLQAIHEAASRNSQLSNNPQAAEAIRQAIETHERKSATERAKLTTQYTNYNSQAERMANNVRQAALDQIHPQTVLGMQRKTQNAPVTDSHQAVELVHRFLEENAREAAAGQKRLQSLTEKIRLAQTSQRRLRRATQYSNSGSHQTALHQDHLRALEETTRYIQPNSRKTTANDARQNTLLDHTRHDLAKTRQFDDNERKLFTANTRRDNFDQSHRQGINSFRQNALNQERQGASNIRQQSDKVRESLTAKARIDAFDQSLKDFRQNKNYRTSASNDQQAAEQAHRQSISEASRSSPTTDYRQMADSLLQPSENNQRRVVLDKARLEAIQEASRIAQNANAQQLTEVLRESFANNKARQLAMEQASQQAKEILKSVQGVNTEEANLAFQQVLAESTRQTALNQVQLQALQAASRAGQSSSSQQTNHFIRKSMNNRRQNAQIHDARKSISNRLQSVQGHSSTAQSINSRESLASNDRQYELEQARREALNEGPQYAEFEDDRQGADTVREALSINARQTALNQGHRQLLNNARHDGRQINDKRQEAKNLQQAAYEAYLA